MKPFDDFHTFTHRHGPNAKSQVATEDKMVVNVSRSILQVKLSTVCSPPSPQNTKTSQQQCGSAPLHLVVLIPKGHIVKLNENRWRYTTAIKSLMFDKHSSNIELQLLKFLNQKHMKT